MGPETKGTPREFLLDCARFYRGLGFFAKHAALTDDQLAEELERIRREEWEWHLDPDRIEDQLVLASWDEDRVWWEDAYEWMGDLDTMYADALQGWARISRGAFRPTDIVETWAGDEGPIAVEFTTDGVRYRLAPKIGEATAESLDLDVLAVVNGMMAPAGLRFVEVDTTDQTTYLVVVTPAERGALAQRGWPFLDEIPVGPPPPKALARPGPTPPPPGPPPAKKGWFSRR